MTGSPYPVLVVGDANVDLVLRGDVVPRFGQAEQLLDGAELVLGGSASIVASGLARLGVPTWLAAVVGDDEFGRFTRSALGKSGVQLDAVRVDPINPTGISVILSAPDDRAILTLAGTIPMLTKDDVLAALEVSQARWVHFASPFLMPAFTGVLPELLTELRVRGVGVSLDTNWDPTEDWAGLEGVLPLVDVLLPNRTELEAIAGVFGVTPEGLVDVGTRVVVKDGADGGWSLEAGGSVVRAPGIRLDVVDTTGAGDSFDAGYLAAIAHGVEVEETRLRWATVAGSLSTRASGGTGAQAGLDELREHL
ncbi:carbohydrate kinase family protein [Glaciihabitans arcticus]|uniref:Carbohydrate kinase family protein n=1 Tax=Glaciihabitans arcticus TaxID=2668039 RepID=A0A4Q9GRW2_9MICO|nr:carbohydrate kinase family protein [Glaciihabitans arcticus]TBN57716.1 carbohydrate kinase family protein [Glaciihabitans arcticus]